MERNLTHGEAQSGGHCLIFYCATRQNDPWRKKGKEAIYVRKKLTEKDEIKNHTSIPFIYLFIHTFICKLRYGNGNGNKRRG